MAMGQADIEMLLASLSVQSDKLEKQLAKATGVFDKQTLRMERRAANMTKQVNAQFAKVRDFALGTAAIYGVSRMISSVVAYGSKLKDTSEATKMSTKFLQQQGIMAGRTGVEQDALNESLATFSKNVGLAQMGGGKAKKIFEAIGIDVKGAPEEVYYRVADAVAAATTQEQKIAIVTRLFGDQAKGLVPIMEQGSASIRQQAAEFEKLGMVLSDDAIKKLDEAGDSWEDLKRQLLAQVEAPIVSGILDSVKGFSGEIGSAQFKSNMKEFGERLGDIAKWVAKIAPYLPAIAAVWGGARVGKVGGGVGMALGGAAGLLGYEAAKNSKNNVPGGAVGRTLYGLGRDITGMFVDNPDEWKRQNYLGAANSRLAAAQKDVDYWQQQGWSTNMLAEAKRKRDRAAGDVAYWENKKPKTPLAQFVLTPEGMAADGFSPPQGKKAPYNLNAAEDAKKDADLAQKRSEVLARATKGAEEANADRVKASQAENAEMARGTDAYYAARQQQIDADADAEITAVLAKRDAELNGIKDMAAGWQQYGEVKKKINEEADASIGAINARRTADLSSAASDLRERTKELKDHVATLGMTQEAAERYLVAQQSEAVAAALEAAGHREAAAALRDEAAAYAQASVQAESSQESMQKQVQIADDFRDTLANIIVNFSDAKSALASFLQMLAKMAAMESIESIFGKRGTPLTTSGGGSSGGSGMWSDLISSAWGGIKSIAGYASGTNSAPGGIALVGEQGPELVNLPGGSSVTPTAPTLEALRGGGGRVSVDNRRTVIVQGNADSAAVRQIQAHDRYLDSQLDSRIELVLARLKSGRRSIFN